MNEKKNRANTLSAILSNMKDLEGAYESAMNAEGSALKENAAYLDSIQGRIDQFTNALQTMWMNFINADVVKFIVSVGTGLLTVVDKIGVFTTALSGILIYFTAIKKNNPATVFQNLITSLQNYNNAVQQIKSINSLVGSTGSMSLQQFNAGPVNAYAAAVSHLSAKQQAATLAASGLNVEQIKAVMTANNLDAANIKLAMSEAQVAQAKTRTSVATGLQIAAELKQKNGTISQNAANFLLAHSTETVTKKMLAKAVVAGEISHQEAILIMKSMGVVAANNAQAFSWKALGTAMKAAFMSNPVGMILTIATTITSIAIPAFKALTKSTDEMKQSSEDALNEYAAAQSELSSMKSDIDELSDDYRRLSLGVDEFGNNISLTTSEYERYNEIVNKIADMFPQMVRGYTDEGNAIIKNKGSVEALTQAYKALQEQANNTLLNSASDIMKTYKATVDGDPWQWDNSTSKKISASKLLEKVLKEQDTYDFKKFDNAYRDDQHDMIPGLLSEAGISRKSKETNSEYVQRALREFPGIVQSIINSWNSVVDSAVSNVQPLVRAYLDTSIGYAGLTDEQRSVFDSIASSFDADFFSKFDGDVTKMYQTIENMILNLKSVGFEDEYTVVLNARTQLNNNDISVGDYHKQIQDFVAQIEELYNQGYLTEDDVKYIKMSLGFEFDSEGNIEDDVTAMINHAKKIVDSTLHDQLLTLNYSDLVIINSEHFNVDGSVITTWEQLNGEIKKAKALMTEDFEVDDFAQYAESIGAVSSSIATYKEALEKLESGQFTMTDFVELVAQFPELAHGVDTSSKEFKGLAKNLRMAIRNSPDELIDDLKELRKQLLEAGKSTVAIDMLINSLENMPDDSFDGLINKYITLTEQINLAIIAQNKLKDAMNENPNEGFETRGGAIDQMKTLMEQGAIGSESELWSIAEAFGFTYDSAKTINENADALAKFLRIREEWYATDENGNYTYEGTEKAIKAIEGASQSETFKRIMASQGYESVNFKWNYENGVLDFDFDNADWDLVVAALAATEEAAGLTSEEFYDLLMQCGQFFDINWQDNNDVLDYLNTVAESTDEPTEKLKQYGQAMQDAFGGNTKIDLTNRPIVAGQTMRDANWDEFGDDYATVYSGTYSNKDKTVAISATPILPDGKVLTPKQLATYASDIAEGADPATYTFEIDGTMYTGEDIVLGRFEGEDAIQQANEFNQALHVAQEMYDTLRDPLKIETTITKDGLKGLEEIEALQGTIRTNAEGTTVVNIDAFSDVLEEAGYAEDEISSLIAKIQEYENVVSTTNNDPLGFNNADASLTSVISALDFLNIEFDQMRNLAGEPISLNINASSLIAELQAKGWTKEQITTYLQELSSTENGLGIKIDGKVNLTTDQIDAAIEQTEKIPEQKNISLSVDDEQLTNVENRLADLDGTTVDTYVNVHETTTKTTTETKVVKTTGDGTPQKKSKLEFSGGSGGHYTLANGTAHAHGAAYESGSWGAQETTEALVGELGPELRVRGNEWTLIGQNGAEFTDVRRGDIIFNHRQTEDLFKNGYVTGRGKAYASGTALASGSGKRDVYTFKDTIDNLYLYDGKYKTPSGNVAGSASNSSNGSSNSDSKDFEEVFDWIEVLIEEINDDIELHNARLENAIGSVAQNKVIDSIIDLNEKLYDNLLAGASEYYSYANKLLEKVPAAYREAAQDGKIAIEEFAGSADEATLEAIQNYREWVQKGDDLTQQAEEVLTEISNLAKQAIDNIATDYENKMSNITNRIDQLDAYNALTETTYGSESEKIFSAIIAENNKNLQILQEQRDKMLAELNAQVEAGHLEKYSQNWYDAVNDIAAVDTEIIELTTDINDLQYSINELHWEHFDNLMDRINAVTEEAENLIDILGAKDVVDEDGNWTKEGITSLGLYAQQLEAAEVQVEKYRTEIDYLNKNWKKLGYTEQEYFEKLEELKGAQYDAIKAYNDTKDAIVDLNAERVDAIKEGIQKEIEAYEKLISAKKEELDAEKD